MSGSAASRPGRLRARSASVFADVAKTDPDTLSYNRAAWDHQVAEGNMWTRPVDVDTIEAARRGDWSVVLIGLRPTRREWFPDELTGLDVLCLAAGGGQQGPVLAAAGANVTVFDNSPAQLERDRAVSAENDLGIETVQGDMADLSAFDDECFDLVFHPVSNIFASDVRPVWLEAFRTLREGGRLLAGFMNPAVFLFDNELYDKRGERVIRYALPYADARDLPADELSAKQARNEPLEFGHTLDALIGGQLAAGFQLIGFDEAGRDEGEWHGPLHGRMCEYIATCAVKPPR
jgi:SAM-dependent methyltransferase